MRRECRERFPRHMRQRKPLVSDLGMHPGTCMTHVPWCMSGSLTRGGGENVPGIPGACATRKFAYLARGPWIRRALIWKYTSIHSFHLSDSNASVILAHRLKPTFLKVVLTFMNKGRTDGRMPGTMTIPVGRCRWRPRVIFLKLWLWKKNSFFIVVWEKNTNHSLLYEYTNHPSKNMTKKCHNGNTIEVDFVVIVTVYPHIQSFKSRPGPSKKHISWLGIQTKIFEQKIIKSHKTFFPSFHRPKIWYTPPY